MKTGKSYYTLRFFKRKGNNANFPVGNRTTLSIPEAKIVLEYGSESLDSVDLECVVLGGEDIETIQAGRVYTGKEGGRSVPFIASVFFLWRAIQADKFY